MLGLGLSIPQVAARGSRSLVAAIRSLFAANEPGVWYDPSDLSTLFQDAAGTTPVTAVEQPVGLMLDKSKGLVRGPELVTNGGFDNGTTGWVPINTPGVVTESSSVVVTNTANTSAYEMLRQAFGSAAGKTYECVFDVEPLTANTVVGVWTGAAAEHSINLPLGRHTVRRFFTATSANAEVRVGAMNTDAAALRVHAVSVRELPGNHAYQTTATSRPVLSARYNLLTKTEQFDDSSWSFFNVSGGASRVGNTITFGTSHVDRFVQGGRTLETISYTASIVLSGTGSVRLYLLGGDGSATSPTIVTLTSTPTRYSVTRTPSASGSNGGIGIYNNASGTPSTVTISFPDVRPTNDGANLPPYQRVNTATDYDAVGFPHYLLFDGVDDWLVTNTITPGIDKVQVFAGVRKLSDAAVSILAELSVSSTLNNGVFALFAPNAAGTYALRSKGITEGWVVSPAGYASPIINVITGLGDISGDRATLRVNGSQAAQSTNDQGSGNFLDYPMYIGRRGGTALQFNGHLYGLIVRFGSNLPDATIEKTEKYINTKTRAY